MVARAGGERHVGDRRILTGAARHRGTVGDEQVGHIPRLIPAVQDAVLGGGRHAGAAHFVNAVAGRMHGAISAHVNGAGGFEDFDGAGRHVLVHRDLVFSPAHIDTCGGNAPLVFRGAVERDAVIGVRQRFAPATDGRLIPTAVSTPTTTSPSDDRYHLQDRLFTAQLATRSPLAGKTLAESRLGDVLGVTVPSDRALLDNIEKFRTELVDTCMEMDEAAMEAYLEDCFAQVSCPVPQDMNEAKDTIGRILRNLERNTLPTDYDRDLSLSAAIAGIIVTLYSEGSWPYLSAGIEDALKGDGTMLLLLADFYNDRDSEGGYLTNLVEANSAIACADEKTYPVNGEDLSDAIINASPVFGKYFAYGDGSCFGWPEGIGNTVLDFNVTPSTKPLIIGTTGDPATPYQHAIVLSELLKGSDLLTFEGEGHTAYGSNPCVDSVVDSYLAGEPLDKLLCSSR